MIRPSVLALLLSLGWATLTRGTMAFVGFNSDGTDGFALVALADYAAGTTLRFQDNEWDGSAFNTGEGSISWTSAGALSAGTILRFDGVSASASVVDGSVTPVAGTFAGGNLSLANNEEAVYAFLGSSETSVTTPLASVRNNVTAASGLLFSSGVNLTLGNGASGVKAYNGDVWAYTGPTQIAAASLLDFAPLLSDLGNWTRQGDGSGDQSALWGPPTGRFSLSSIPEAGAGLYGLLVATITAAKPRRRRE